MTGFTISETDSSSQDAQTIHNSMAPNEHTTQTTVAFDLENGNPVTKAYFYPIAKGLSHGASDADLMLETISRLLEAYPQYLAPFVILSAFLGSSRSMLELRLKMEMIAFDCVKPMDSRLKIYVRTPRTSLSDIREVYTLGQRLQSTSVTVGLQILEQLWTCLFGSIGEACPLPSNDHRTSGIIFNSEMIPGQDSPQPKVYIPVRRYCRNDLAVAESISSFFHLQGWTDRAKQYANDLRSIL